MGRDAGERVSGVAGCLSKGENVRAACQCVCEREKCPVTAAGVCEVGGVYFWGRDEQRGACVSVRGGAPCVPTGSRVCRGAVRVRGVSGKEGAARKKLYVCASRACMKRSAPRARVYVRVRAACTRVRVREGCTGVCRAVRVCRWAVHACVCVCVCGGAARRSVTQRPADRSCLSSGGR